MTSFNGNGILKKKAKIMHSYLDIFTFSIDYLNQVVGIGKSRILLLFNRNLLSRHSFCMNSSNCINIIISIYNPNQTLNHENYALCSEKHEILLRKHSPKIVFLMKMFDFNPTSPMHFISS